MTNLSDHYARAVGPIRERHVDPEQQGAKAAYEDRASLLAIADAQQKVVEAAERVHTQIADSDPDANWDIPAYFDLDSVLAELRQVMEHEATP